MLRRTAVLAALAGLMIGTGGCGIVSRERDGQPSGPAATAADASTAAAGPADGPAGAAKTTFEDVRLADNAVTVDADAVRSGLRRQDGTTYRFTADTPGIDKLRRGSVALFADKALRKVTAVRERGDEVVVETAGAKLNEYVTDGEIGYSAPMSWADVPRGAFREAAAPDGLHPRLVPAAYQVPTPVDGRPTRAVPARYVPEGELSFSGTVKGFEVSVKLEPSPEKLGFEMEAKRANARLTAKGSISNFVQEARFRYDGGRNTLVRANVYGLQGDVEVTWSAVGHGSKGLDSDVVRFKLPFEVPIPVSVAGIPFTLKVSSNMRFVPVLNQQSSSGGSWKMTYRSDQGFTQGVGSAKLYSASAELGGKETVTAGYIPTGIGYGWEFPRLELGIAGMGAFAGIALDSYASGQYTPGTTLTAHIPPCQMASLELKAVAVLSLNLLGIVKQEQQITLWKKKWEKYKDNKPCTLDGKSPAAN